MSLAVACPNCKTRTILDTLPESGKMVVTCKVCSKQFKVGLRASEDTIQKKPLPEAPLPEEFENPESNSEDLFGADSPSQDEPSDSSSFFDSPFVGQPARTHAKPYAASLPKKKKSNLGTILVAGSVAITVASLVLAAAFWMKDKAGADLEKEMLAIKTIAAKNKPTPIAKPVAKDAKKPSASQSDSNRADRSREEPVPVPRGVRDPAPQPNDPSESDTDEIPNPAEIAPPVVPTRNVFVLEPDAVELPAIVRRWKLAPDGKSLVMTCKDGSVRMWDVERQKELWANESLKPKDPENKLQSISVSYDGKIIAVANNFDDDSYLKLLDFDSGKLHATVKEVKWPIQTMVFHPEKPQLLMSSSELKNGMLLWDVQDGKEIWSDKDSHTSIVYSMAYSKDGKKLISSGQTLHEASNKNLNSLVSWEMEIGEKTGTVFGLFDNPRGLVTSRDGKYLSGFIPGSRQSLIGFWNWDNIKVSKSIPRVPVARVENEHVIDFLNDNKTVVVACEDKSLQLFDLDKKELTAVIPDVFDDRIGEIVVMPTGNTILTHSKNKEYCIWKLPDTMDSKNPTNPKDTATEEEQQK